MIRRTGLAALAAIIFVSAIPDVVAQPGDGARIMGTRLDVTATGEVSRIPDIVRIEAGVRTEAPTAAESMRQNQALMARVRAALDRAGVQDRDIQTSTFALEAVSRQAPGLPLGRTVRVYETSNELCVRIRNVSGSGAVLDALVAEGVNDIQGPILGFENVEQMLDEARARAITAARARADLYARGLGLRVKRAVEISEGGGYGGYQRSGAESLMNSMPAPGTTASTIDTGGRRVTASVHVVFELE